MKPSRIFAPLLLISACATALSPAFANPAGQPQPIVVEEVSRADFTTTLDNLKRQLEADGWNLVAEINLGARLAKKNVAIPGGLVILELTSGKNAVPLLQRDETRYVAALMPCSVSIYGMSDGRVMVSRMNAGMMAGMLEPEVAEVMKKSAKHLDESITRALAKSGG
jgi:uncharacterized protein (DUF302 family)